MNQHIDHSLQPSRRFGGTGSLTSYVVAALSFALCAGLVLALLRSQGLLVEEAQQILFPVAVVAAYFVARYIGLSVPLRVFFIPLALWAAVLARVPLMYFQGYFNSRIVVGKFSSDTRGMKARKFAASLKRIGRTYHLPGPVLLSVSQDQGFRPEEWLQNDLKTPALIVIGTEQHLDIFLPRVAFAHTTRDEAGLQYGAHGLSLRLPDLPISISLPAEPEYATAHYIAWLSGYFSNQINAEPVSRNDVLYEAANQRGISQDSLARALVRLLLSYEAFTRSGFEMDAQELLQCKKWLPQVMAAGARHENFEMVGAAANLLALVLLSDQDSGNAVDASLKLLNTTFNDTRLPAIYRSLALYNHILLADENR